jgi:threonine dehydrogenase-like Zn-dependent dehydrogenase
MRAVVCERGELSVTDLPEPRPGEGQLVLDVAGCGICGSDLHARLHADAEADVAAETGYDGFMRSDQQVVFGHEFVGTVAEHGPGTSKRIPAGTAVVALPLRRNGDGVHAIGLSAFAPGAYAERVVVEEAFTLPVPAGLPAGVAALTEPMAVGCHAVRRSEITRRDAAVVIGCGPVGLAVICMLKAHGVGTVVASDLAPGRRELARACGADVVVDPGEASPYEALGGRGYATSFAAVAATGLAGMRRIQRIPVPWPVTLRALERLGVTKVKRPVIFECVGVPGVIESIITAAPIGSRVVVAGVCMEPDRFRPAMAINKEIDLRFVLGYSPLEFRDTLRMLADGKVDAARLRTGTVGLEGVPAAFDALASPGRHAKIVIDPTSPVDRVSDPA